MFNLDGPIYVQICYLLVGVGVNGRLSVSVYRLKNSSGTCSGKSESNPSSRFSRLEEAPERKDIARPSQIYRKISKR